MRDRVQRPFPGHRLAVAALLAASLLSAGCERVGERSTRNEIHKLAYRAAQVGQALAACEADGALAAELSRAWDEAFSRADGWIGLSRESISGRHDAGREAFEATGARSCAQARAAAVASIAEAWRWAERIGARRLCTPLGCGG